MLLTDPAVRSAVSGEGGASGFPSGGTLAPWVREPHRLWSLLEIMERFHPEPLLELSGSLGLFRLMPRRISHFWGISSELSFTFSARLQGELREEVLAVERDCLAIGLPVSAKAAQAALQELASSKPSWQEFSRLAEDLHGRLRDEISSVTFLALNLREAELYGGPRKEWEGVLGAFKDTVYDVEEAAKCLALERSTAAVFHLMRIIETGLRALGKALNDPTLDPKTNPSWDKILKRAERELQKPRSDRSPEWVAEEQFYSTATANIRAVQYAWRNPTLHIERSYNAEEAREVFAAVRSFMRHLATKLSE